MPPENATGNFTKIVQRVPVRIALDDDDATLGDDAAGPIDHGDGGNASPTRETRQ